MMMIIIMINTGRAQTEVALELAIFQPAGSYRLRGVAAPRTDVGAELAAANSPL